jgi:hypothetical protein
MHTVTVNGAKAGSKLDLGWLVFVTPVTIFMD